MKTIFLFILLGLNNPYLVQTGQNPVIKAYLSVKEALVKGDSKGAAADSRALLEAVGAGTFSSPALKNAAKKLAAAKDIEKQRGEFAALSIILWELVKQSDHDGATLYYQYCPMKKAYWLSAEAAIKNPYYGTSMLNCGSVSDQTN